MIIGIDPGLTGGLAAFSNQGSLITVADMPTMAKATGKGNQVDGATMAKILRNQTVTTYEAPPYGVVPVFGPAPELYVERVQAMPGQGVTSMFGFGFTAGMIEGVVTALGYPLQYVQPQAWKKHFGLIGKDKDAARTLAIQRFPEFAALLSRKKDIGRADAILIGLYGIEKGGIA